MVEIETGQWLQALDIEDKNMILQFTNEGAYQDVKTQDGSAKRKLEIGVKLPNGVHKDWTMNDTSVKAVATAYGKDSKDWIDKPVEVFLVTQNVGGNIKEVIYARIPQHSLSAATQAACSLKKTKAPMAKKKPSKPPLDPD